MNTLEAFQMRCQRQILNVCWCGLMSPMQRCFSDLVCQPLATSYVIDAYLCLAMLHVWTLEYQHMMLCVWSWLPTKVEKPAGEDRRVALATSGSTRCRRIATLYCYLYAVEIWDRQGSHSGATVTRTTRRRWWWWWLVSKMDSKTNYFFKAPTGCPEPGLLNVWNHWRRE